MTRVTVHEYAAALRPRYRAAKKGEKAKILGGNMAKILESRKA